MGDGPAAAAGAAGPRQGEYESAETGSAADAGGAGEGAGNNPGRWLFLAEGFGAIGDTERALEYTARLLRADPDHAQAMGIAARMHQAAGRHEDAVSSAVDALALVYYDPAMHCVLARSLGEIGEIEQAEQEFRVALAQAPGMPGAHEGLGRLLRRDRARWGEAALHLAKAGAARERRKKAGTRGERPNRVEDEADSTAVSGFDAQCTAPPGDRSKVVTIVAGLPRSGTSMMMQMLAAGGIEPYSDGRREADEDNPHG